MAQRHWMLVSRDARPCWSGVSRDSSPVGATGGSAQLITTSLCDVPHHAPRTIGSGFYLDHADSPRLPVPD